jgi:hypothetical protein
MFELGRAGEQKIAQSTPQPLDPRVTARTVGVPYALRQENRPENAARFKTGVTKKPSSRFDRMIERVYCEDEIFSKGY